MSVSISALSSYQGKGSYSICMAILCVVIGIIGSIRLISSCVTIVILVGSNLEGHPGLLFLVFP